MKKLKVAFDLDGCLIHLAVELEDTPRYETIELLRWFYNNTNCEIYVWSGGGIDYTKRWVEKLGLNIYKVKIIEKGSIKVDIAIDDEEVKLGKVNIKIGDW